MMCLRVLFSRIEVDRKLCVCWCGARESYGDRWRLMLLVLGSRGMVCAGDDVNVGLALVKIEAGENDVIASTELVKIPII